MTEMAERIEKELRQLPSEDIIALYASLVSTIHEREDAEGLDSEFCAEIERRIAEINAGQAPSVEAFQAVREM